MWSRTVAWLEQHNWIADDPRPEYSLLDQRDGLPACSQTEYNDGQQKKIGSKEHYDRSSDPEGYHQGRAPGGV